MYRDVKTHLYMVPACSSCRVALIVSSPPLASPPSVVATLPPLACLSAVASIYLSIYLSVYQGRSVVFVTLLFALPSMASANAASAATAPGAASSSAAPGAASSSAAPTPAVPAPANPATTLVVNPRQKGNPILKFVRNVTWAYGETPADYMMSESAGGLFLSLRYHQLHPNYLARRLGELLHHFTLRVVRPRTRAAASTAWVAAAVTATTARSSHAAVASTSRRHRGGQAAPRDLAPGDAERLHPAARLEPSGGPLPPRLPPQAACAAVVVPCAATAPRLTADGALPAPHLEQEAARYLETLKAYARKPADLIQGQNDRAFMTQLTEASSQ